jgi:hypothetical protein
MTREEMEMRVGRLNQLMTGMPWELVALEMQAQICELTGSLIAQNNDETRGRIKALQAILNLPEALHQEREGLTAALSEQDAANN